MRRIVLLITFFSMMSITSCARKEVAKVKGPFVLKLGYIKGKKYIYETNMSTHSTARMSGMSHTTNVISNIKYEIEPDYASGDTLEIITTIKDANIYLQTIQGNQNLPEGNNLIKKSIKFTVLKNGNIIKKDTINISDEKIKNILENMSSMFNFVPDVPVKINSTWRDSSDGSISDFKLLDVKVEGNDTVAIIGLNATFDKTTSSEKQGMNVKTEIKGKGNGKIYFSINRGIILKEEISAGLEGNAHMEGGMAGSGMDVPLYIDQNIETKFEREE